MFQLKKTVFFEGDCSKIDELNSILGMNHEGFYFPDCNGAHAIMCNISTASSRNPIFKSFYLSILPCILPFLSILDCPHVPLYLLLLTLSCRPEEGIMLYQVSTGFILSLLSIDALTKTSSMRSLTGFPPYEHCQLCSVESLAKQEAPLPL